MGSCPALMARSWEHRGFRETRGVSSVPKPCQPCLGARMGISDRGRWLRVLEPGRSPSSRGEDWTLTLEASRWWGQEEGGGRRNAAATRLGAGLRVAEELRGLGEFSFVFVQKSYTQNSTLPNQKK